MNKIKKAWIGLGVVIALTACKKESQVITGPGGLSGFAQTEMEFVVTNQNREIEVPFVYTKYHSAKQRGMIFSIDPKSTAQRAVQFELPTAIIYDNVNGLIFSAFVNGNKDGFGGTFPITFYPDKITEPVVLVLNAVNSSDEEPVEGCYPQLTIYIRPGRTVVAE